jgi:hypothetical protein
MNEIKENRINKVIIAATFISFLMVLLFVLLGLAQQKGMLPFDFSVQAATEAGIQTFHLKEISEEAWKRAVEHLFTADPQHIYLCQTERGGRYPGKRQSPPIIEKPVFHSFSRQQRVQLSQDTLQ